MVARGQSVQPKRLIHRGYRRLASSLSRSAPTRPPWTAASFAGFSGIYHLNIDLVEPGRSAPTRSVGADVCGHVQAHAPDQRRTEDVCGHVRAHAPEPRQTRDVCGHVRAHAPDQRRTEDVCGHVQAHAPDQRRTEDVWGHVPRADARKEWPSGALCNRRDVGVLAVWTFPQPPGRSGRSESRSR